MERERRLRISSARRKCITKQQPAGGSGTLKRVTEKISHTAYNIQAAGITNRKKIKILVTKVRLVVRKPERGRRRKKRKKKKIVVKIEEEEEENSSGTMLLMKSLWEYIHCSSAFLSPYAVLYRAGFLGELLWQRKRARAFFSESHIPSHFLRFSH